MARLLASWRWTGQPGPWPARPPTSVVKESVMSKKQPQNFVLPAMKYGDKEYNASGSSLQGKKKSCSSLEDSWDRSDTSEEHSEYGAQSSIFQEKNGNVEMKNGQEDLKVKHTPYNIQEKQRSVKWHDEDSIHINMWRDKKLPGRKMEENPPDVTPVNWFKITIPEGIKYDKTWLINLLRSHCNIHFIPVDFHYVKNRARFFIQDPKVASALMDVDNKLYDEKNQEICILVQKSTEPYSEWNMLGPEELEKLELTMKKRYDASQKALDLQKLRFDPDLVGHEVNIILNRRSCMSSALKLIKKNFPQLLSLNLSDNKLYRLDGLSDIVQMAPKIKILNLSKNELKSTWEVCKVKGLRLEELWLDGNPLCDKFIRYSYYVSSIRAFFPTLLCLDGKELPSPGAVGTNAHNLIKFCKESYEGSETLKNLVLHFLQKYYRIYDYGDRQSLLNVYHDEACFCFSIPFIPQDAAPISFRDSRDMKMKDQYLRCELVKYSKRDIIKTLRLLPQTQHDLSSFQVDMWKEKATKICFSVHGVYKELVGRPPFSVHAFSRTFTTTLSRNSSLYIVNDEMVVTDTFRDKTTPFPPSTSSNLPVFPKAQYEKAQAFSKQSKMNQKWSQN